MLPADDGTGLWCQFCGVRRDDPDARQTAERAQVQLAAQDGYTPPSRDWEMPLEDRRLLDDAWKSIQAGDTVSAAYLLREGVSRNAELADGWYLLSLTTGDPGEKMTYLDRALELQPYHEYAWRDKGVLEGVIPDQPAAAVIPDPTIPQPDSVDAESETHACPLCGGTLVHNVALGALICGHCGHRPGTAPAARAATVTAGAQRGYQPLDNALLQRRFGFSREWHIGERVLVCQNCHAQLTLSGTTLSTQCPFCDSAHVLVQDAVGSFEQPDALLPFTIDRTAAAKAVHRALEPAIRPQIERGEMQGVYLPFWSFKALVSIWGAYALTPATAAQGSTSLTFSIPLFSFTVGEDRPRSANRQEIEPFRTGVYSVDDALVGGVSEPRQPVLYELMPYDLRALVPYDPRYLAQHAAQIYSIDVVQASITARAYAKHVARRLATGYPAPPVDLARTDSSAYNPPDTPLWRAARVEIEALSYRLILLPVWMITLILRSGLHRPAVVNGQTGEAILTRSFHTPDTILNPRRASVEDMPLVPEPRRRAPVIRPIESPPARASVIRPLKRR